VEPCVDWPVFQTLHLYTALALLRRVSEVRGFLLRQYGDLESAMKAIDQNKSKALSRAEFCTLLTPIFGDGKDAELRDAFEFLDVDGSNLVTTKELIAELGAYDEGAVLDNCSTLRDACWSAFGDLDEAFTKLGRGRSEISADMLLQNLQKHGETVDRDTVRRVFHFARLAGGDRAGGGLRSYVRRNEFLLLRGLNTTARADVMENFRRHLQADSFEEAFLRIAAGA